MIEVSEGKPWGSPVLLKSLEFEGFPVGFTRDGSYYYRIPTTTNDVRVAQLDPTGGVLLENPGSPDIVSATKTMRTPSPVAQSTAASPPNPAVCSPRSVFRPGDTNANVVANFHYHRLFAGQNTTQRPPAQSNRY